MTAELQMIGRDPALADLVDWQRGLAWTARWPREAPRDQSIAYELQYALTGAVIVGRFARYISGRNDG